VLNGIKGVVSFAFGASQAHEGAIAALGPRWTARGMERCLDIAAIEVRRIAQLIYWSWASLINFVNVEAAVDILDIALGRIKDVAVVVCARRGLDTARGEDEVLVNELLITTSFMRVLKAGQGACAEMEELRIPLFDKWIGNDLFLNPVVLSNARIIDESTWILLDLFAGRFEETSYRTDQSTTCHSGSASQPRCRERIVRHSSPL
jgi:hypothetical protein